MQGSLTSPTPHLSPNPCRRQLYRIVDGALYSEVLGSPLERRWFRPTSILWPHHLVTLESLCQDRATLVSFVTVPGTRFRFRCRREGGVRRRMSYHLIKAGMGQF